MIIIFFEYVNDSLTNQRFYNIWDSARRIFRVNTAGLRVRATKLLVLQNKQQRHHSQTNSPNKLHSM
jgi:hypothetical protein